MADIKEFMCVRPKNCYVKRVAALPYDVFSREEAKQEIEREPLSFLKIDRADTQFTSEISSYDECVYEKTRELFEGLLENEIFIQEENACLYIYELGFREHIQSGIVTCVSIDDFLLDVVKKHENTRKEKELDRIKHIEACQAQTGPILMAYRAQKEINELVSTIKEESPIYDFIAEDGISHKIWRIEKEDIIQHIKENFKKIGSIYIADGHHRAASAVQVGLNRRKEDIASKEKINSDYVMSVLFPHNELTILGYHRVVKDLCGYTEQEFLKQIEKKFYIDKWNPKDDKIIQKGVFGMYLSKQWYQLKIKNEIVIKDGLVESLDVSILQDYILEPILGIINPRTDKRIDFIGGNYAIEELEDRVARDMKVAFYLAPTSIDELMAVADCKQLMPPKSTWFEPKLRSGLFVHKI